MVKHVVEGVAPINSTTTLFFILFFDMNEFMIFSSEYRFRNKFGMTRCSVYSGFDSFIASYFIPHTS